MFRKADISYVSDFSEYENRTSTPRDKTREQATMGEGRVSASVHQEQLVMQSGHKMIV